MKGSIRRYGFCTILFVFLCSIAASTGWARIAKGIESEFGGEIEKGRRQKNRRKPLWSTSLSQVSVLAVSASYSYSICSRASFTILMKRLASCSIRLVWRWTRESLGRSSLPTPMALAPDRM